MACLLLVMSSYKMGHHRNEVAAFVAWLTNYIYSVHHSRYIMKIVYFLVALIIIFFFQLNFLYYKKLWHNKTKTKPHKYYNCLPPIQYLISFLSLSGLEMRELRYYVMFVGEMENRIGGKTKYLRKENLKGGGRFSFMFFDRRERK